MDQTARKRSGKSGKINAGKRQFPLQSRKDKQPRIGGWGMRVGMITKRKSWERSKHKRSRGGKELKRIII